MCRLFGVATPRYRRMPMFRFWWGRLTLRQKAKSLFGTVKRIFRKGLRKRAACTPFGPTAAHAPMVEAAPAITTHMAGAEQKRYDPCARAGKSA